MQRISFATHAFWRDYEIVLAPNRFKMIVEGHRHSFADVIVVLNNFRNRDEALAARAMADHLIDLGLATKIIGAAEYLTTDVLTDLGLDPLRYWCLNPYFSSAQFAALHYAKPRCEYLLHMTGDVWLQTPCQWIPKALTALEASPDMAGFNLCCTGHEALYERRAKEQNDHFWISRERRRIEGEDYGFTISDRAYVLRTDPGFPWRFPDPPFSFVATWVSYARPSFESYVAWSILSNGRTIGALKPINSKPIIAHKSFPRSAVKRRLYYALGRYSPGGRYASVM